MDTQNRTQREIKFRAWDNHNKEWVYSNRMPDVGFWKWVAYDSTTIFNEYTGLKDKNGVDIYEGDIVGIVHKKLGLQNTKKIFWNELHACFDWEDANDDSWPDGFTGFYDEYEVIGNVYENPELLQTNR